MEDELIAKVQDETIVAASAGVAVGKCAQIANGGLYYYEQMEKELGRLDLTKYQLPERKVLQLHDEKTNALLELIDELGGASLFIAYEYEHDLHRIAAKLWPGVKENAWPVIQGGTTPKRSALLATQWNSGNLPVLLGQPQAMGHGLNLQTGGNHICWVSVPWDLEAYEQTNRRFCRSGSIHAQVFIYHIVAHGTVDVLKLQALKRKASGQRGLLDALKQYAQQKVKR
jgi:hypothetical protein